MSPTTRTALTTAAERIGANNHRRNLDEHLRRGRLRRTYRPTVSPIHADIIRALNEDWIDDDAMALLHTYDADRERFTENAR